MTSRKSTTRFLKSIGGIFDECWDTLSSMRGFDRQEDLPRKLYEFQPKLAEALHHLSNRYRTLYQERRGLISRKPKLNRRWFQQRMKSLADCQAAINQAISTGKALGDCFAWLFYHHDMAIIEEHYAREYQHYFPPGGGGLGELGFIQNIRLMDDCFVVFHGTTSFLRIGDFSLYNVNTHKITAIGEIKTTEVRGKEIECRFYLYGDEVKSLRGWSAKAPTTLEESYSSLPDAMIARLRKQLRSIENTFQSIHDREQLEGGEREGSSYHPELEQALATVRPGQSCWMKLSPSLLVNASLSSTRSFSRRCFSFGQPNTDISSDEINALLESLVASDRAVNSLVHNYIQYDEKDRTQNIQICPPALWWPIPIDTAYKLIFHELIVITVFNSGALIEALEKKGLRLAPTSGGSKLVLNFADSSRTVEISGSHFYLYLTTVALWKEDSVAELIASMAVHTKEIAETRAGHGQVSMVLEHQLPRGNPKC